jgi:hypothetical protein
VFSYYLLSDLNPKDGAKGLHIPTDDEVAGVRTQVKNCVQRKKDTTQDPQKFGPTISGGFFSDDTLPDPPGDLTARQPLGPAIVVSMTEQRTLLDHSQTTSDFTKSELNRQLVLKSFPVVDESEARELDSILDRRRAVAVAAKLGARYLLTGHVTTNESPPDDYTGLIAVQVSATLELIDDTGKVLFSHTYAPTADNPQSHSDMTEAGAAAAVTQEIASQMANDVAPVIRQALGLPGDNTNSKD